MKCRNCFNEVDNGSKYCSVCGADMTVTDGSPSSDPGINDFNSENALQTNNPQPDQNADGVFYPYQNPPPGQNQSFFDQADFNKYTQDNEQKKVSVAPLVTGPLAVFLVLMNLLLPFVHLIGLALGIVSITVGSAHKKLKYSYATAGIVLGIIAVVIAILFMIIGMMSMN